MKKFAFVSSNQIKQCYDFLLNKQKSHKYFMDISKISWLLVLVLLCGFIYFRYVSLASTEGYFLRKANNDLATIRFRHEIVKTEVLEKNQKNREKMHWNNYSKQIIDIRPEIVKVQGKTELTYK